MANFYSENLDLIFLLKIEQIFIWKNADQIFIKNMVVIFWKNADLVFY